MSSVFASMPKPIYGIKLFRHPNQGLEISPKRYLCHSKKSGMSTLLFVLHCYLFELDDKVIMKPLQ